ncbi:MAG TPA: GtrA family protein [Chloroflexota bacterium]|nr:GtrA family protein [Chloroflexota bacterium]
MGTRLLGWLDVTRLVRFGLVGLTGVGINLVIVQVLFGRLHWTAFLASAIAVELSVVNNFLWNNWWTFGQRTISPVRFARFNLASLGGLLITSVVFTVLVQHLALYYLLADLIAIGAATGWNFVASVFWTWAS